MHGWQNLWDYKLLVFWFQRRVFKVFPHFKSIEAYDSMASIDTRSMDGKICVGDQKTYIYKLWASSFQRRRFLKVFPIIRLYMPEFQSNQPKNHMHPFPFHT